MKSWNKINSSWRITQVIDFKLLRLLAVGILDFIPHPPRPWRPKASTPTTRKSTLHVHHACMVCMAERRAGYSRRFRPEFIGALHSYADKYATLYDHYMQVDPGATPTGQPQVPHPGTANSTMLRDTKLPCAVNCKL